MRIQVIHDLHRLADRLAVQERQVAFAAAGALNDVAFELRRRQVEQINRRFDRPTPAARAAFRVLRKATKIKLEAEAGLSDLGSKSGAAGMDAPRAIGHHWTGGRRRFKRFEAAFHRLGYLAAGEYIAPPRSNSWAMPLNAFGNMPPARLVQLLSYFAAFQEQGYRANITDKSRARIERIGKTRDGYRTINGVKYFVVPSPSRRSVFPRLAQSRFAPHLHPGIWAKRGIHGVDLAPVALFVSPPSYARRFDLPALAKQTVADTWQVAFRRRLDFALRTAR